MSLKSVGSAIFFLAILFLVAYVFYLQCRLDPIFPPDDEPISQTFEIKPEDFKIADGGGCEIYKGNLTFWQALTGVNGSASYTFPDTFEQGVLTLNLQVRRDNAEATGGLTVQVGEQTWVLVLTTAIDKQPFIVVSDTLNTAGIGSLRVFYSGDDEVNVDLISGKLELFKN
jgi:hypothetical protein